MYESDTKTWGGYISMYVCLNSVYVRACVHDCVSARVCVRERVNVVISLLLMGK